MANPLFPIVPFPPLGHWVMIMISLYKSASAKSSIASIQINRCIASIILTSQEMVTIMTEWLKGDLPFKVDVKQVDLFIEERQKVIQSFFQVFDNEHTAVLTAIAIHQAPYHSFKSELELSFKPATLKEPHQGKSASGS